MTLIAQIQGDGVLTVTFKSSDGRIADVADFYVKPLMDGLGMNRAAATEWQQQFAGLLLRSYERHFTEPAPKSSGTPEQITGDKDRASVVGGPHSTQWVCPIGRDDCFQSCGNYGCGN